MSRARLIGLPLLLAAIALVAWLALDPGADHSGAVPVPASAGEAGSRAGAESAEAGLVGRAHLAAAEHRSGGRLTGTVFADGIPIAAQVELRPAHGAPAWVPSHMRYAVRRAARKLEPVAPHDVALQSTRATEDGVYRLAAPEPGTYVLRAVAASGAVGARIIHIQTSAAVSRSDLHVAVGAPSLFGIVRDEQGRPWRGWVRGEPWSVVQRGQVWHSVFAETDEQGRYALHGLAQGSAYVTLVQPGAFFFDTETVSVPRAEPFDITLGGEHTVRGRVVHDDTDAPLGGVIVEAVRGRFSHGCAVVTGADGTFTIPTPVPATAVHAHRDGFATASFRGARIPETLVLRLRPAATVRGRLVDVEGRTVPAGVPVHGDMRAAQRVNGSVWSRSDASGAFELPGLHEGDVRIVAWGGGWVPARLTAEDGPGRFVTCAPGRAVDVEIPVARAGRITGRVVDAEGDPVAEAEVRLGWDCLATMHGVYVDAVTTDTDGRFHVPDVPAGSDLRLVTGSPHHAETVSGPYLVKQGEVTEVEIRLPPSRWCEVLVRDAEGGAPIAGAWVRARVKGAAQVHHYGETWRTDAEGRVRVGPLHPGPLSLRAGGAEHLEHPVGVGDASWLAVADDAGTAECRLERAATIEGGVTLDGRALRQAFSIRASADGRPGEERWWVFVQSGPDGRFRIQAPPGRDVELSTGLSRGGVRWVARRVVAAGARDVDLPLKLERAGSSNPFPEPGATWRIRVLGPDGAPVRAARASALLDHGNGSTGGALTASAGTFEIRLRDDTRRLWLVVTRARTSAGALAGCAHFGPWDARGGEDAVTLPRARALAGRVVDGTGKPLLGVRVEVVATPPQGFTRRGEALVVDRVRTDAAGRFRVEGLGDGDYRLRAEPPGGFLDAPPLEVQGGREDVRLTLRRGLDATIAVVDAQGRALARAFVVAQAHHPNQGRIEAWTDAAGIARLPNLDPAWTYGLTVTVERGEQSFTQEIEAWRPRNETMRFVRTFELRGVVRDPQGRPLPRVTVRHRDAAGTVDLMQTGPTGRFSLYDLPAGPVQLWLSRAPLEEEAYAALAPTAVEAGRDDVALVFDPGPYLEVLLGPGEPSVPILFSERAGERWERRGLRQVHRGRAVFYEVRAGATYRIHAGPTSDGRCVLYEGVPAVGAPLQLTLRAGGVIRGTVRDEAGKPAAAARVLIRLDGVALQTLTDRLGRYTLEGVPPGAWTVEALLRIGARNHWRKKREEAGGTADFDFRKSGR